MYGATRPGSAGGRRPNIIEAVGSEDEDGDDDDDDADNHERGEQGSKSQRSSPHVARQTRQIPDDSSAQRKQHTSSKLAQPRARRPKRQPKPPVDPVVAREQGFVNKAKKIGNRSAVWEQFERFDIEGEAPAPLRKTDRQKTWNPAESRLCTLATSTAETRAKARKAHEDALKSGPKRTPKRTTPHRWKPPKQWKAFDVNAYAAKRSSKIKTAAARDWQPKAWESLPDSVYKPAQDIDYV